MLDIGGADPEAQRAERTVGCGVAVAGAHDHARQDEALLGCYDMLDALPLIEDVEQLDAEIGAVLLEKPHLVGRLDILDMPRAYRVGRIDVINDGERGARAPACAPGRAQTAEGLRAGILVQNRTVDVQEDFAGAIKIPDGVGAAELFVERTWRHSYTCRPETSFPMSLCFSHFSIKITPIGAIRLVE